jgi:hypothetical protein
LTASDLLSALTPVVEALEALGVDYYVGGSVASSAHGVPRSSIDADLVAGLEARHVAPFVARLRTYFYLDEGRVRSAVAARRSFNLIHLDTMFKVDVFVSRRRPFDLEAQKRARPALLQGTGGGRSFSLCSAEDTVLAKLEWFRAGGEASERQWADVVGLLRTLGTGLDQAYLRAWAAALGVTDLLERAQRDAAEEEE